MANCYRCHKCGGPIRVVLDGEEWCPACGRYQRPAAHGWSASNRDFSPCPVSREKVYVMERRDGRAMAFVEEEGRRRELPHVVYHSPTGFEWGYGGSGPADLARSILTDAAGRAVADKHYQDFKWKFVASLPFEGGEIAKSEVIEWLRARGVRV